MKHQTPRLILLFSLLTCCAAFAQGGPIMFEEIDTDRNGAISREEAMVRMDLSSNFDAIDKNGNGSLSVDEYSSYHNKGQMVPEVVEIPEPGAAPVR
ncbi:MAG TPA: EF-hand domain-containing protein [Gammaproteobacteria bacterium]|jgi:Ca2+-binding EF-hand superfamily protein